VALGASVGQLSLALRQSGSFHTTASRRIGLEDLGKAYHDPEAPKAAPASSDSPIVTVTRGARERSQYEITPFGRRELKVTNTGEGARDQPVALENGVSQIITRPQ
jgi:hypothetical protein